MKFLLSEHSFCRNNTSKLVFARIGQELDEIEKQKGIEIEWMVGAIAAGEY